MTCGLDAPLTKATFPSKDILILLDRFDDISSIFYTKAGEGCPSGLW